MGIFDWGYFGHRDHHRYKSWKDNLDLYEDALAEDAKVIDPATRLYYSESPADIERLRNDYFIDQMLIRTLRPTARTMVGGYAYQLVVL